MIGPNEIHVWAESCYDDFLRSIVDGRDLFSPPLRRDRLGQVPASDDPATFAQAVSPLWEGSKQQRGFGYTVVLESRQRRKRGLQNEPVAVEFTSEYDFVEYLGCSHEVAAFRRDVAWLLKKFPAAKPVFLATPRLIRAHDGAWQGIAEVVDYLRQNPRPGCFMRALPVSVPTKFIEQHLSAIEALLSVHPETGYRPDLDSVEDRCGFAKDDSAIRGRFLCSVLRRRCGFEVDDLELRVGTWATLQLPDDVRVVACENKTNFLALPPMEGTLALWGGGGAAMGLFPQLSWLKTARFLYWGDLDPSGFGILATLRASFSNVRSVLMDAATLAAHEEAIAAAKPPRHPVRTEFLTASEAAALGLILQPPRGIEQEKLLFREGLRAIVAAF